MKETNLIVSQALAGAQDKLYAMIYVLMAGSFDTMDVLQETNAAILKHAALYDVSRPALPWFKAFAMNQVLYYRRVKRDDKLIFDTDMINDLAAILDEFEKSEGSSGPDYVDLLEKCLEKLPPWQRELLKERYQKGTKVNEMAATRLMSRVSLSVLMFRIRKVLQTCMEKSVNNDEPPLSGKNTGNDFINELEAVLDGLATHAEAAALLEQMRANRDLQRVYVMHARLHALMHCRNSRLFSGSTVCSPSVPAEFTAATHLKFRYPVALAVSALLLLGGGLWMWQPDGKPGAHDEHAILVSVCEMDEDQWLNQITPLDLQAYEENLGFHKFQEPEPEMIKYEPGLIVNPGAAIEILAMEGDDIQGRHLVKGDKVWREHLNLPAEGSMKFKLETGATITLIGPATLDIEDAKTVSLRSGAIMVECNDQMLALKLPHAEVHNCNALFCADNSGGQWSDVMALSGIIKVIGAEDRLVYYLTADEGFRLAGSAVPIRFRLMASQQDAKDKFLSGKSKIVMNKGRL